jgi:DNA-binding transcriptional regulator LsrR (DeoR family)
MQTISKISERELLVFEAARLCYDFDISQREVAKTLGISPATLTRLLQKAKELGIITISVQPPYEYVRNFNELASKTKQKLALSEVIIVPSSYKSEVVRKELGFASARWISSVLSEGMTIGFSGGRSIAEIIPFLKKSSMQLQVVQLMGGVSPTEIKIQADVIARETAARLGGVCHVIHGPAIFPNENSLAQLLSNRIVSEVIKNFDALDVAVAGIGALNNDNPLMQCGFLTDEEIKHLLALGCVGDICGHFFNQEGEECDPTLSCRILGVQLSQLIKTPKVCAVAAGLDKVPAVIAACKAKVPKTLITDIATAKQIAEKE